MSISKYVVQERADGTRFLEQLFEWKPHRPIQFFKGADMTRDPEEMRAVDLAIHSPDVYARYIGIGQPVYASTEKGDLAFWPIMSVALSAPQLGSRSMPLKTTIDGAVYVLVEDSIAGDALYTCLADDFVLADMLRLIESQHLEASVVEGDVEWTAV